MPETIAALAPSAKAMEGIAVASEEEFDDRLGRYIERIERRANSIQQTSAVFQERYNERMYASAERGGFEPSFEESPRLPAKPSNLRSPELPANRLATPTRVTFDLTASSIEQPDSDEEGEVSRVSITKSQTPIKLLLSMMAGK